MQEPELDKTKGHSEVTIVWKYSSSFLLHQVNKTSWKQKDLNHTCDDDGLEHSICCYSQRRIWKTENLKKGLFSKCFLFWEYVGHLLLRCYPTIPTKDPSIPHGNFRYLLNIHPSVLCIPFSQICKFLFPSWPLTALVVTWWLRSARGHGVGRAHGESSSLFHFPRQGQLYVHSLWQRFVKVALTDQTS